MQLLFITILGAILAYTSALRLQASQSTALHTGADPFSEHDGKTVYIKSLKSGYSGKFLTHRKKNGKYRGRFRNEYESQVIGNSNMKWTVRMYGNYFTLENQGRAGQFFKAHRKDEPVRISGDTYPQGEEKFLWKASGSQSSFRIQNKAYEPRYMYVQSDGDLEFTTSSSQPIYYKFWTPVISEFTDVVSIIDNPDSATYSYSISFTVGISTSQTFSITTAIETEVSSAVVGASIKGSISTTWSQTTTYYAETTQTHSVTLGQGRWEFRQLKATYGSLTVASNSYGVYKVYDY